MVTKKIEEMLNYPTPPNGQEMVFMSIGGGGWVTAQNASEFAKHQLMEIDRRIDCLVKEARALGSFYKTKREARQSVHTGTRAEKFDPLMLYVTDERPSVNRIRIRWALMYPLKNPGKKKHGTRWLPQDKGGVHYNLAKLQSKAAGFMEDVVKVTELTAAAIRIELRAITRQRRSVVAFDQEYRPARKKAFSAIVDYYGGVLDLRPYISGAAELETDAQPTGG
jgi:hypothetical protein